jgi:UDP-galactopyranose mutase
MKLVSKNDAQLYMNANQELDILCLSHLRWNFVYQRPQHLLSRAASRQRVFFFEEPLHHDGEAFLEMRNEKPNLIVAVPHLPHGLDEAQTIEMQEMLLDELISTYRINNYLAWYYTPMALKFTKRLTPDLVVYDCMDQLSHFKFASPELPRLEQTLFKKADLVFTGGYSLYEAKRDMHPNVYAFPSSVDVPHFAKARTDSQLPEDMKAIKGPKIGYMGVIDERIDLELIEGIARMRPEWNLIMLGPVVKIDPANLPQLPNIHYLGGKGYDELPHYLASWDIGMLPFARNDATRYISPTKTPEYLAAGLQVISTSIRDVCKPYGELKLAAIADAVETFVFHAERMLEDGPLPEWKAKVDAFLSKVSWDKTFESMHDLIALEDSKNKSESASAASAAPLSFSKDIRMNPKVNLNNGVAAMPS